MVFLAILAPQACAQRKVVSDYNYQKAVDAFFLKTKMMTRLSSLLINNLTRHQIIGLKVSSCEDLLACR